METENAPTLMGKVGPTGNARFFALAPLRDENDPFPSLSQPRHKVSSKLPGAMWELWLPLCWEADAKNHQGADYDPEDWFTAWDHGAIDPMSLIFAPADSMVDCHDCLEWMHA